MILTPSVLGRVSPNTYTFGITEWGRVIHKIRKSIWQTDCELTPLGYGMTAEEVWSSGLNLCNGCFR